MRANSRRSSSPKSKGSKSSNLKYFIGFGLVITLVAGALVGSFFLLKNQFASYTVKVEKLTAITRDVFIPPAPNSVTVEQIFTQERVNRLEKGEGLELVVGKTFRGKLDPEFQRLFKIDPLESVGPTTAINDRITYVQDKKKEFGEIIKWFQDYQSLKLTYEIYVDDTSGVDQKLRDRITKEVAGLNLADAIARDDKVEVIFSRISATTFINAKNASLVKGVSLGRINELVKWVTTDEGIKTGSSVYAGLANAMSENKGKPRRTVLVFSDGLENTPTTTSFYTGDGHAMLMDEKKWEDLDKLFLERSKMPAPELTGSYVDWFTPPIGSDNTSDKVLLASRDYWKHLLKKWGAEEVNAHF